MFLNSALSRKALLIIGGLAVTVLVVIAAAFRFVVPPKQHETVLPVGDYDRTPEGEVMVQANDRLNSLWNSDHFVAKQFTIEWLRKQSIVQDAGLGKDNATIWIKFKSGLESQIMD